MYVSPAMYFKLEAALEAVNATLDVIIPDMSEAIQQSGNVTDTIVAVRGGGIRRGTNINLSKFNSHKNVS